MTVEKRSLYITMIVEAVSKDEADLVLCTIAAIAGTTAEMSHAAVTLVCCPPDAPREVLAAATRVFQPAGRSCPCKTCAAKHQAPAGELVPLDLPDTERVPVINVVPAKGPAS